MCLFWRQIRQINNDDDDQLLPKKTCVYGRVPPHRSISQIVDRSKLQHKMENFFLEKLILLLLALEENLVIKELGDVIVETRDHTVTLFVPVEVLNMRTVRVFLLMM